MKTTLYLPVFVLVMLTACSIGVKKDLLTGLAVEYNGLSVEESAVTANGSRLSSSKAPYGAELAIVLDGVSGFAEENGMIFPGCSMKVTDKSGSEVLNYDDLFADYSSGVEASAASTLNVNLTVGEPMEAGQTYTWAARFWDKKKETSYIIVKMEVEVAEE